ncbi:MULTISPECIES: hypothetical protein [unclassified Clostridium]|uniref:hypothetical protein n=1 Tax=unclassified Clostridium TaxID=2614128 RepID=UPI001C8C332A|nr:MULTISPECIES: hypothetical protein [unclassified Clostridium]MBX9138660.1 hypothetical protein [Clostridium sp. K12(2020)]MBX9145405.1 hypothetical protein [Clostridium sp. K13]MDU1033213.1 hypothetical protein [Clostridium sp.]
MEQPFIDAAEMTDFIFEKCTSSGYEVSKEIIDLVLDLEMQFLESKGIVTYTED